MATGDLPRPTRRQRRRIDAAVARAEATTGLQLCVFLGAPDDRDPHEHAEAVFVEAGLVERPAVLILVAPKQHRVEVITGPHVRERISDDHATVAVAAMTEAFRRGDLTGGLVAGIEHLATSAGPGEPEPGAVDIANVFDPDD